MLLDHMNLSTFSPSPPAESVATPCSPFSWSSSSAPSPSVVESPAEGVKLDIFLCHMCEVSDLKVYTKLPDLLGQFQAARERFAVIEPMLMTGWRNLIVCPSLWGQ